MPVPGLKKQEMSLPLDSFAVERDEGTAKTDLSRVVEKVARGLHVRGRRGRRHALPGKLSSSLIAWKTCSPEGDAAFSLAAVKCQVSDRTRLP